MTIVVRAVVAVALLAGYYLLALVFLGLAVAAAVLTVRYPNAGTIKLTLVMLAVSVPLLGAMVRAVRQRAERPAGVPVTRADEPVLWNVIDDLAARVGTRPPDEVLFVPEVNAAVSEDTRWLGLRGRRRYMLTGVPLLETLTIDQMRAVLGHELGHYSGRHTRLGGLTYRGAVSLAHTVEALSGSSFARRVFEAYAKLYFRVSQGVRRRQEIEADRFMVQIAGRAAAATALQQVRATAAAWSFFLDRFAGAGVRYGLAPADLFGGFRALLAEPSRRGEMAEVLRQPEERDPYDSHPTLAERLEAIGRCPEPQGLRPDQRLATALLTDPHRAAHAMRQAMFGDEATVLDWAELVCRSAALEAAEEGTRLLEQVERVTGAPGPAPTLGTVLDLLERGGGPALAAELCRDLPELPPDRVGEAHAAVLRGHVIGLFTSALLAAGSVRYRFSWSGAPARPVAHDGTEIDMSRVVPEQIGPRHVPGLRSWLRQAGVDLAYRPPRPDRASIDLLGVLYAVEQDGEYYDALVLDVGLLFVRLSGTEVMRGGMSQTAWHQRTEHMLRSSPAELLERDGNWLLGAKDVTRAAMWAKGDKWTLSVDCAWTDDQGVRRQAAVRVQGKPPCTEPAEAMKILHSLLGPRITWSQEKL
ncbi:M48 family metallopeptidase [Actinomadura sp. NPDC047616]|uniref:M48 family metallopeptidase n=1 Tax=Actinomadura sp. NPDC047616 TaxID=3155914 RepID=UPI0033FB0C71